MAQPRSPEDLFLELMRDELQEPALSLDRAMTLPLAKVLLKTLARASGFEQRTPAAERRAEVRPEPLSGFRESRAVIAAALHDTFDFSELDANEKERNVLLAASDLVMINGERRLRLGDAARAEVLSAAMYGKTYEKLLRTGIDDDAKDRKAIATDPIRLPSAWLRRFLSGEFTHLEIARPAELNAAYAARERLRLVTSLPSNVPPLADLARRVGLAELVEPLRLLIGSEGGWDGTPARDRFVGREQQVTQLRAFVDELSSRGAVELVTRFAARAARAVSGSQKPALMIIAARGGLGKSTLLAKFVIDHALAQSRQFPFAYLDFDRASLDPERPRQLLIEIARQVGLQFAKAQPQLDALMEDIRAELVQQAGEKAATTSDIEDPFARFVEIVREHATFGKRAFLLVLDTVEVVQWNSTAMEKLAGLVDEFRDKGLDELCVVASGRADVPELRRARGLRVPAEKIRLKPLLVKEARQMADALGQAAIGKKWKSAWSAAIAGATTNDEARREPLAVRVAVDLIARADPEKREDLAREITDFGVDAQPRPTDAEADEPSERGDDFVARLYEKRIVSHVRDPHARKLAWPGLVIRRVTKEIARELLAPLCEIAPEDAEKAFDALGREVWMVTREGDALRHRPDLRARTLPLMRNKDGARFSEIARAAVEYFAKHRERSREDYAEWIYHRLLLGESPQQVESDITPDVLALLGRAAGDFPRQSAAASYIAARTARARLSPRRIRELTPGDALYHLGVVSAGSFALDDASIDGVALDVADRISGGNVPFGGDLHAWARALWIKTGAWQKMPTDLGGIEVDRRNEASRAHVFWAARIAPVLDPDRRAQLLEICSRAVTMDTQERAFRAGVNAMALARISRSDAFEMLDKQVARTLQKMKPDPSPSIQAALRTAIVLGESSRGHALALWLAGRRRGSSERVSTPTVSLIGLRLLSRTHPGARDVLSGVIDQEEQYAPARFSDEATVAASARALEDMLADLTHGAEAERSGRALSRIFACRDEDWIVPFGYAAARARSGPLSATLSQRLAGYAARPSGAEQRARDDELPGDMLEAMRMADEAGDLPGFSRLVLSECDPNSPGPRDLEFLLYCRNAWSRAIDAIIGSEPLPVAVKPLVSPAERPPEPDPVIDAEDPQKGRWGGRDKRDGRGVRAVLESVERNVFYFSIVVESTDDSVLEPPVVFHLHSSFPRSVITVRRIADERRAILSDGRAYGVFAIGVQVRDRSGKWTSLELDLADLPGLPKRFLER